MSPFTVLRVQVMSGVRYSISRPLLAASGTRIERKESEMREERSFILGTMAINELEDKRMVRMKEKRLVC